MEDILRAVALALVAIAAAASLRFPFPKTQKVTGDDRERYSRAIDALRRASGARG